MEIMEGNRSNILFKLLAKYVSSISATITGVLLVFLAVLITVDVIGRSLFSSPTLIADPASGYTLVGLSFLGLAYTELAGKHVTVSMFTRKLPPKKQKQLEIPILILTLIFAIWFTWILFGATKVNFINHVTSTDALHIRVWIPYAVCPIGAGMYALALLTVIVQKVSALVRYENIERA